VPAGQQGPSLTITASDVADYVSKRDDGQSVVAVAAGEQLTEFQLLEGLLVPSGNNIADLIARWDAGSVQAFVDKMNAKARTLGHKSTFFADASGYDPKTVSTPSDLVKLGVVAIANQMIADVVSEGQAQLPVAGTVYNVDYALGQGGIAGIKTGSSPQAGACFLFSAPEADLGRKYTLVGAVVGVSTLDEAFAVTKALIKAASGAVHVTRIASKDQAVGRYVAPWSSRTDIVATTNLDVVEWPGTTLRTRLEAPAVEAPVPAGSSVGDLYVKIGDQESRIPVATSDPLFEPGNRWRLTRTDPFF
jgi:D-alanyl-D-alanine carboxypeptidase (penicillin-binding protein 5/6)